MYAKRGPHHHYGSGSRGYGGAEESSAIYVLIKQPQWVAWFPYIVILCVQLWVSE